MRQFLSPRFWVALLALGGLTLVLVLVFRGNSSSESPAIRRATPVPHRVDLVAIVAQATPGAGFAIADGVTTADLALQLDATRTMLIKAGTPGDVSCTQLDQPGQCAVAVDLLGDAVLWFSIVPGSLGATLALPAVTSLPETGWVQLANHWIVRRSNTVDRSCPTATSSLTDFIHTFGVHSTSTFNLETQRVVQVVCPDGGVITTDSVVQPNDTGPLTTDNGTHEGDTTPGSGP